MNSKKQTNLLNERVKRALKKLTKTQKLILWIRIEACLVAYRARHYVAGLFVPQRARVHWVGPRRRRRPERAAIGLLIAAIILLKPYNFVLWSLASGSVLSLFLIAASVYRYVPRKRTSGLNRRNYD